MVQEIILQLGNVGQSWKTLQHPEFFLSPSPTPLQHYLPPYVEK